MRGGYPNVQDSDGETALIYAVLGGHLPTVQALVESGANANVKDNKGLTALRWAEQFGNEDLIRILKKTTSAEELRTRLDDFNQTESTTEIRPFGIRYFGDSAYPTFTLSSARWTTNLFETGFFPKSETGNQWRQSNFPMLMEAAFYLNMQYKMIFINSYLSNFRGGNPSVGRNFTRGNFYTPGYFQYNRASSR
jgi:hypothetical protein